MTGPTLRRGRWRNTVTWLAVLAFGSSLSLAAPARDPEPAAIVTSVSGTAQLKPPSGPPRGLGQFDRLLAGAALRVDLRSVVTVAFANGQRFELEGGAEVAVGREGFTRKRGLVRTLTPVPPLLRIPPVRDLGEGRTAALRVRGQLVGGLYPRDGAALMAGAAMLRFSASPESGPCMVEVSDAAGSSISRSERVVSEVALPPGILVPGERYTWRVRCPAATGVTLRADASFVTLPTKQEAARTALKAAAQADATLLALLAEIDQGLGLLREAREEFRAASAREPGNVALGEALTRLDRWMSDPTR
jgi:hypothetical protein